MFFTATDIANFVACRHLLTLKLDAAKGKIQKPYFRDLGVELLRELGDRAPYNAQVAALRKKLPDGARVGTVDKFQGQEAPIVFYSMATSSSEDAPRGMDFLYSLNRLNVAISRARCVAAIFASPALFQIDCKTLSQMELANAFCRNIELV